MDANPAGTAATWLWQAGADIPKIVEFVAAPRLREVYVAVPLSGVDDNVAALTTALRANGIAVSCLGGDPTWTVQHDTASNWAFRATTDAVFDSVHLDVEPWALLTRIVHQCDSITVLAYRDRASTIVAEAEPMLRLCETAGTGYRIGVETQPPSSSVPTNTTFADDGEAVMRRELTAVAARLQQPLFDGFAVHHLRAWQTMPP